MGEFREHGLMLYLGPQLYSAFIRLQADKDLGRSYAGLLAFVEGLHELGYLSDKDYAVAVKRYNQPMNPEQPETPEVVESKPVIQIEYNALPEEKLRQVLSRSRVISDPVRTTMCLAELKRRGLKE